MKRSKRFGVQPEEARRVAGIDLSTHEAVTVVIPAPTESEPQRGAWTSRQINWPQGIDLNRNTYGKPAHEDTFQAPTYEADSMFDPWTNEEHAIPRDGDERDNLIGCILERSGRKLVDVDRRFAEYLAAKG